MKLAKDAYYLAVIAGLVALCGQFYYSYEYLPKQARQVKVAYNQDIEANRELIKVIQEADKFVYFAIYTFTRLDIKDALLSAKKRGLEVKGVTDRSQIERIELQAKIIKELREAGIPIATQDHLGIMHLKTLVTEKAYFSGSYNWTASGTNINDEIIEIGKDESTRQIYQAIVEKLLEKYRP